METISLPPERRRSGQKSSGKSFTGIHVENIHSTYIM